MKFSRGDLVMMLTLDGIATVYGGSVPPSECDYHKSYTVKDQLCIVLQQSDDREWYKVLFPSCRGLIAWISSKRLRFA